MEAENIKLAVVDDEPAVRRLCEVYFKMAGYDMTGFESGESFLESLASGYTPGAVLLDVMMPGMSGLEVCRVIKNNPGYNDLKVVIFTALSGEPIEIQSKKAGADALICKGMDMQELTETITAMVAVSRA